MVWAS
ncbi:rCG63584 [Rattus norvegicus]